MNPDADEQLQLLQQQIEKMHSRRYWTVLAFLLGIPLVVFGFVLASALTPSGRTAPTSLSYLGGSVPLLAWEWACAASILRTVSGLSHALRRVSEFFLMLVLAAMNLVVVYGVWVAACSMFMRLETAAFHPQVQSDRAGTKALRPERATHLSPGQVTQERSPGNCGQQPQALKGRDNRNEYLRGAPPLQGSGVVSGYARGCAPGFAAWPFQGQRPDCRLSPAIAALYRQLPDWRSRHLPAPPPAL